MDPLLVIIATLVVVLLGLIVSLSQQRSPRRRTPGGWAQCDAGDAEIEAVDIDQMLDALNERKRRAGRAEIGDELAKQLEPHLRDG